MGNLQKQIEALDHQIDLIIDYYFLDEENYPLQSLNIAIETLGTHPDLDEHLPGNTLDALMIDKGELKKKLFKL